MMAGDPMGSWLHLSRQAIDVQKKALEAGRKTLGMGDAGLAMQRAAVEAAEANLAIWQSWMRLGGIR